MTAVQKPLERSGMLEKSQLCCIQPTGGGAGEGAGRPVSSTGLVKAHRVWPSPWGSYTKAAAIGSFKLLMHRYLSVFSRQPHQQLRR